MAYSIPTTSFYGSSTQRIRFRDNGVNVETRNQEPFYSNTSLRCQI